MSYYCPNCGSKADPINGTKPRYCSSCGYEFNSLAAFLSDASEHHEPRRPRRERPERFERPHRSAATRRRPVEDEYYDDDVYDEADQAEDYDDYESNGRGFNIRYDDEEAPRGRRRGSAMEGVEIVLESSKRITAGELAFQEKTGFSRGKGRGFGLKGRPSSKRIFDAVKKSSASSRQNPTEL